MKNFRDNFDDIYVENFTRLCRFACEYLGDFDEAKNLVQDVFLEIWKGREGIEVRGTVLTYLCTLVRNKCIDALRHRAVMRRHSVEAAAELREIEKSIEALEGLGDLLREERDLERFISEALASLPEKCREIFLLNRVEGKKYREIAEILGISINTVETQMGIALKKLRSAEGTRRQ